MRGVGRIQRLPTMRDNSPRHGSFGWPPPRTRTRPARALLTVLVFLPAIPATAQEVYPVRPYVDSTQLDVPWPKHSHCKQPWRAFLETRSGYAFTRGIGINFNVRANEALVARLLAESGFRTFRIEIGWGHMRWDERGFQNQDRWLRKLALCRQYGIRPTILLNAHHGAPCPVKLLRRRVAADAAKGDREVRLDDTRGLVAGRTGLCDLTGYWAAEALFEEVDPATGACRLSKPLPKDLAAGTEVKLAILRYLPLYPVGTPEFDDTAAGWVRYALTVCRLAREAGLTEFDLELWNELTFGSNFLNVNRYHDPPAATYTADFLRQGGQAWELARRTIEAVKRDDPEVRCIWGFSNTTFFHTPIDQLPPGTDGQSYHPYGTGTRSLPEQEYHRDRPGMNLEGYTPELRIRMPEGWAHTFIQTESLMRLLNPNARHRRPPGVARFYQYITEHGVAPRQCGVADEQDAWELKARCALRSFCLYLHKGIDALHYYCADSRGPLGMGLLPVGLDQLPADAAWEEVATLPMRAVRKLTEAFRGSVPLTATHPLRIEIAGLGEQQTIFDGNDRHPPLWHREVLAVLPFQIDPGRFLIAVYVVTYDITVPLGEERYRVTFRGLPDLTAVESYRDPITGEAGTVENVRATAGELTIDLPVTDYPRLLLLRAGSLTLDAAGSCYRMRHQRPGLVWRAGEKAIRAGRINATGGVRIA